MRAIILYSYKPLPDQAFFGGFEYGVEGEREERVVRKEYEVATDVSGHDYLPTHERRLLRLFVPEEFDHEDTLDYIETNLLDVIEGGYYDGSDADLGRQNTQTPADRIPIASKTTGEAV